MTTLDDVIDWERIYAIRSHLSPLSVQLLSDFAAERGGRLYNTRHVPVVMTSIVHNPAMSHNGVEYSPRSLFVWARDYSSGNHPNSLYADKQGWRPVWQFYLGYGPTEYDKNYTP